jgi:hypothetical protein
VATKAPHHIWKPGLYFKSKSVCKRCGMTVKRVKHPVDLAMHGMGPKVVHVPAWDIYGTNGKPVLRLWNMPACEKGK